MKLSFTGTQKGMTLKQMREFSRFVRAYRAKITEFHHGVCIGSDEQAHNIMRYLLPGVKIIGHLGDNPQKTAKVKCDITLPPLPNLIRNQIIAREGDMLVATPRQDYEVIRSGTWTTVRRAREMKKKVVIILPSGYVL